MIPVLQAAPAGATGESLADQLLGFASSTSASRIADGIGLADLQ